MRVREREWEKGKGLGEGEGEGEEAKVNGVGNVFASEAEKAKCDTDHTSAESTIGMR